MQNAASWSGLAVGTNETNAADPRPKPDKEVTSAVMRVVPDRLQKVIGALMNGERCTAPVEELRFRIGKPVQIITAEGEILLSGYSAFTAAEARTMLEAACENSVYSKEKELADGFVTLAGGARVGVCGKPLVENGRIARLTTVSSFNIRIPREVTGCAEAFMPLFIESERPRSCIICAPPGAGKTTLLRDIARCFSDGIGVKKPFTVALADERSELSGSVGAVSTLSVGTRTDVMSGAPKTLAIPMLLRSMRPDVIITDEIAGSADAEAVSEAAKYGVAVIASIHAGGSRELSEKAWLMEGLIKPKLARLLLLYRKGSRLMLKEADLSSDNAPKAPL